VHLKKCYRTFTSQRNRLSSRIAGMPNPFYVMCPCAKKEKEKDWNYDRQVEAKGCIGSDR